MYICYPDGVSCFFVKEAALIRFLGFPFLVVLIWTFIHEHHTSGKNFCWMVSVFKNQSIVCLLSALYRRSASLDSSCNNGFCTLIECRCPISNCDYPNTEATIGKHGRIQKDMVSRVDIDFKIYF